MSINNTAPISSKPTKLRVLAIVMHSGKAVKELVPSPDGMTEGNPPKPVMVEGYKWTEPPYAEIIVQACDLMLRKDGSPIMNELGMHLYEDKEGMIKSIKITNLATLAPFLTDWGKLVAAAEVLIQQHIEELVW